jgi:hypothetical protein
MNNLKPPAPLCGGLTIGLRYSFDIRSGGSIQEVGVDAKTGRVLENAPEGKNPD